MTVASY